MKRGWLLAGLILAGCGYRMGYGSIRDRYSTVSVPYVVGDQNGDLTAALIHELGTRGGFRYCCNGGELIVSATLIEVCDEDIGFRYDRNKEDKPTRCVIPTETRATAKAELMVKKRADDACILGPVIIVASVDFDHDYYSSHNGVNAVNIFSFSLGQVTDVQAAKDVARSPLYRCLARKIVDYISAAW